MTVFSIEDCIAILKIAKSLWSPFRCLWVFRSRKCSLCTTHDEIHGRSELLDHFSSRNRPSPNCMQKRREVYVAGLTCRNAWPFMKRYKASRFGVCYVRTIEDTLTSSPLSRGFQSQQPFNFSAPTRLSTWRQNSNLSTDTALTENPLCLHYSAQSCPQSVYKPKTAQYQCNLAGEGSLALQRYKHASKHN